MEEQMVVSSTSEKYSHLDSIKAGMSIRFATAQELEGRNMSLPAEFNDMLSVDLGVLNDEDVESINNNGRFIQKSINEAEYYISPIFITVIDTFTPKKVVVPTIAWPKTPTDDDIKEMIGKVDRMRFKKMVATSIRGKGLSRIDDRVIDRYLSEWAASKFPYYVVFGRNLSVKWQVELELDAEEMTPLLEDLCNKWPGYCLVIKAIVNEDWKSNSIRNTTNSTLSTYCPSYSRSGMKVTRFMNELYNNEKFSQDCGAIIDATKTKATLAISIDPYDYMSMSLNKYNWHSCHMIGGGEWCTGTLSYLIDDTTAIAYKYNGSEEFEYSMDKFAWKGNSKSWRQCVYLDPNSISMIFSREYPSSRTDVAAEVRHKLEQVIVDFFTLPPTWVISDKAKGHKTGSSCAYSDVENGRTLSFVTHKTFNKIVSPNFVAGNDIYCALCGREISSGHSHFLCNSCE